MTAATRAGALSALVLIALPFSALATTPESHDVTVPTVAGEFVVVEWTGTVQPGSSGAATNSCISDDPTADHVNINLTVPDGAYENVSVTADFHIEWEEPVPGSGVPDLVLTVEDGSDGSELDSSDGGVPEENVSLTDLATGSYLAIACPFAASTPVDFYGRLVLTALSKDPNADSDGDGVSDTADLCPGTPEGVEVDTTGCPIVTCDIATASSSSAAASDGPTIVDMNVLQDWSSLKRGERYGAFVHFRDQDMRAEQDELLSLLGLTKTHDFRRYTTSVFVEGPVWAFQRLADHPWISRVEHNAPLRYMDATQHYAMRTRLVQEVVSGGPYLDANGELLTGKGVRLGAIDSGMFGAHPDFTGHISHNWKYAAAGYVDVQDGDSENGGGGHGTHVSGIVAGNGTMSRGGYPIPEVAPLVEGTFTAASRDAELLHWGQGAGIVILSITAAYQHILDNLGTAGFDNLRAVNNSYGESTPGSAYNPNDTSKQLIKKIVACGVNMVFAAGNDGGDGSTDQTSSYCKDPTPGVICVGSYNDEGTGRIDGALSGFSSRSKKGDASKYVDIAAPGDLTTSSCAQATPTQAICTGGDDSAAETEWQPWYGTISGTSMATPNIVSVIGILAQADPTLTAAEMEEVIQRTARKIGDEAEYEDDPQLPGSTIHYARGAGLVDVQAALAYLAETRGVEFDIAGERPETEEWTVFDGDDDVDITEGAADAIKLTMQNHNLDGITGVMYRLTLENATNFNSPALSYRVETFARGAPAFTTIIADAAGVAPGEPGERNNAVATLVEREGNVVRFFVPYSQMGYPPINEPIHNVRVVVENASGALDYAPSPANGTVQSDAVQPMYGRPFTTRLPPGLLPPSTERACELPGITMATSPGGTTFTNSNTGHDDARRLWYSEPADMPGKLVVTLKVENLTPAPISGHRWYIYFNTPNRTDVEAQFIAMDTVAPGGSSAAPGFKRGYRGTVEGPVGVGVFTIEGDLDAESTWDPDGTITMVMDKETFGIDTGDAITGIAVSIRQTSNPENGSGLTVDSAGAIGDYVLVGNLPCPVVPIPALVADVISGQAPLTVNFDGSGSVGSSPTATITDYEFDFGDGSAPVSQATPTIQHTYTKAGTYTAKLTVTDSDDVVSDTPAEQAITVTTPPGGGGGGGPAAPDNNRLGGALSVLTLLALGSLAAVRRRRPRR